MENLPEQFIRELLLQERLSANVVWHLQSFRAFNGATNSKATTRDRYRFTYLRVIFRRTVAQNPLQPKHPQRCGCSSPRRHAGDENGTAPLVTVSNWTNTVPG
jgi:hypothetical protein